MTKYLLILTILLLFSVLDTWLNPAAGRTHVDVMVPADALEMVKDQLKNVSATFRVMIPDVEAAIKEENPVLSEEEYEELEGRKGKKIKYI
jgi:Carboxypeptidase activation peptide